MKIIQVNEDNTPEKLLCTELPTPEGETIVEMLNDVCSGSSHPYHFKLVENNYKLNEGNN